MRKEENHHDQSVENLQMNDAAIATSANGTETLEGAFEYLKSLPKNFDRPALDSYRRGRESTIIDHDVAQTFTGNFRNVSAPFYIPVSWSMTKAALVNLLGITDYTGYDLVNGVRFYAGLNCDNQLTLIAVSTKSGTGCSDDLTISDSYPYYDYADPCPNSCSSIGNLRAMTPVQLQVAVVS